MRTAAAFATIALAAVIGVMADAPRPTPQTPASALRRPNIVWISNEDMSPRLGAYGDTMARTPVLDRLARESIRYTRAFTTAPVCAPSRAAIITGMYQTAIGAQHMRTTEDRVPELPGPYLAVPPFYVKAFPEYLRAAGYYTTNRAKTDYQFGVPFTIWDGLGPNAHWRNRADKSQPFFSVFNLEVTHESQIFPSSPARKGKPLVTDPAKIQVPPYYPDTPAVREELARVYDNIADMDGQVGAILKQLEDDGLADNTIVFYWSDHGDGVPRAKRSLYDSGLRVPLMIRWPKALGSTVTPGFRQRRARQLHRPRADGPRAGRRGHTGASPGTRARRSESGAGAGVRLCRARPHGHRVRHDALGARRAIPLHPQLLAGASVRRATSSIGTRAPSCRSGSGSRRNGS